MVECNLPFKKSIIHSICAIIFSALVYFTMKSLGVLMGTLLIICLALSILYITLKIYTFPGFFTFTRRYLQSSLEIELSKCFIDSLHELKYSLELLQTSSSVLHIKQNSIRLHQCLDILSILFSSYASLNPSILSRNQLKFFTLLSSLRSELIKIQLNFHDRVENAWNSLNSAKDYDWSNVSIDNQIELERALGYFEALEDFVTPINDLGIIRCITEEGIFTSLEVIRHVLMSSCSIEQHWVTSGSESIDCVIVKNLQNDPDTGVMIYCGAGDGLYEYACYQNQWMEFYISNKIDFCMWNYRGYGRSTGLPSEKSLGIDAEAIYHWLSIEKQYRRIGIHGEHIGAIPAILLAKQHRIDFLFADKAFVSSSFLSVFPLSRRSPFNCFSFPTCDITNDFLKLDCYKILSHSEINSKSLENTSLKYSLASLSPCDFFSMQDAEELFEGVQGLCRCARRFRLKEGCDVRFGLTYEDLEIEEGFEMLELQDDLILELYSTMAIDAGGIYLFNIQNAESLLRWVRGLEIWGSLCPIGSRALGRSKSIKNLQKSISSITALLSSPELTGSSLQSAVTFSRKIKSGLQKILNGLTNTNIISETLILQDPSTNSSCFGFLIPLNSETNDSGVLTESEKTLMLHHLINFISN